MIFVMSLWKVHGQKNPVLYGGMELFRHTGFENNSYGNFSVGSQIYHWKFFAPEVGFSHYGGTFRERGIVFEPGAYTIASALFNMRFNANVFTFSPKIKLGKDDAFLSFSPTYHLGTANSRAAYHVLEGEHYFLEESQKKSAPVAFWSFALGVEGLAIQEEKFWFTLFLLYTEVDAHAALSQLDFSAYDISRYNENMNTIGLGIRLYYNPFPIKN